MNDSEFIHWSTSHSDVDMPENYAYSLGARAIHRIPQVAVMTIDLSLIRILIVDEQFHGRAGMLWVRVLRTVSLIVLTCLFGCMAVGAEIFQRTIQRFQHTTRGTKEGTPGHIRALAQAKNGYLWIGAPDSLYRFDEVSSERYDPRTGGPFPERDVLCLLLSVTYVLKAWTATLRTFALLPIAWLLFAATSSVFALNPHQPLNQLYHSAWGPKQGITGAVTALAQTADGYLWVGTTDGLLRFDGTSVERYRPENGRLIADAISALLATPDGGLWVGFIRGGASFLRNGRVMNYTEDQGFPVSRVRTFVYDAAGRTWAAAIGGLTQFDGEHWHKIGKNWKYPTDTAWALFADRKGNLWAATGESIVVLPAGATTFQDAGIRCSVVHGITQAADDTIVIDDERANRLRAIRLDSNGKVIRLPDLSVPAGVPYVDRDGSLWSATSDGVVRAPSLDPLYADKTHAQFLSLLRAPFSDWLRTDKAYAQFYSEKQGLTNETTAAVIEDREGNIWVGSQEGLDRFRNRNLTWFPLPGSNLTLVAGRGHDVWAASADPWPVPFLRVQDRTRAGAGPAGIYTAFRDRDGSIWYSGPNALMHWQNDKFIKIRVPAPVSELSRSSHGTAPVAASSITKDDSGALWVAFGGNGEYRLMNSNWSFVSVLPDHPDWAANYAFTDDLNRVWLCWGDRVARLDHDQVHVFGAKQGLTVGPFNVMAGRNQEIWVGGESGLAVFAAGQFHRVEAAEGAGFASVTGVVVTVAHGVWLSTGSGIVHIPEVEVNSLRRNPGHKVNLELFDMVSDLPEPLQPNTVWSSGAIQGSDATLWFPTQHGAVQVDPAHIFRNALPPPVTISEMMADNRSYSVYGGPILAPATQNVVIHYDALSLTIPERVRFRYKLDGWDQAWHDAGGRREAFYTHLGPGNYRFHVIACNNDGVWNEAGATLDFRVSPAWYQTIWFRSFYVLGFALFLWVLYQLRLRQLARDFNMRLEERVWERTRIARQLHDTLLQHLHGLMFQFQAARNMVQKHPDKALHTFDNAVIETEQAIAESEGAIRELRSEQIVQHDLAQLLSAIANELSSSQDANHNVPSVRVIVEGERKTLLPAIYDEVYLIAREVLRNAFQHASAHQVEVEIRYDVHAFRLRIRDDGKGIEPEVLKQGKRAGHWGLPGIQERAQRIGAKLEVWSEAGAGTEVQLTVPASLAYEKSRDRSRFRMFRGPKS